MVWDQRQIHTSDLGGQRLAKMALWFGCHQTDLLTDIGDHAHPELTRCAVFLPNSWNAYRSSCSGAAVGWEGGGCGLVQEGASRRAVLPAAAEQRQQHRAAGHGPASSSRGGCSQPWGPRKSQCRKMGASATAPALTGYLHVRCSQPAPRR